MRTRGIRTLKRACAPVLVADARSLVVSGVLIRLCVKLAYLPTEEPEEKTCAQP